MRITEILSFCNRGTKLAESTKYFEGIACKLPIYVAHTTIPKRL